MRPDVGLATLPQRLAGLRQLTPAPAARPQPAPGFADALDGQLADGGLAEVGVTAFAGAGQWAPTRGLLLGQGARLSAVPGVIAPAAGPGGLPAVDPALDPAGGHVVGPLDRSGPPAELQAYGNGRIPLEALEPLGIGDHRLWAPAARSFRALMAAAAQDGVQIGVNSSYRDLAGQQRMVDRYGLYSQGGRAAAPGTSDHGWGLSIDLQLDDRAQAWMRANGARYGFVEDVPREPWHWTYMASS